MSWKAPQRTPLQKFLYSGTGWLCLLIGVIGGFIPVLQGWVFVLAGLMILSREHEWVHNLVHKFKVTVALMKRKRSWTRCCVG
jgi:uncharacterized membrane protein YbaN (DUF454 family)